MEKYLKETKLLNYRSNEITTLIARSEERRVGKEC